MGKCKRLHSFIVISSVDLSFVSLNVCSLKGKHEYVFGFNYNLDEFRVRTVHLTYFFSVFRLSGRHI